MPAALSRLPHALLAALLCALSLACYGAALEVTPISHELTPQQRALGMTLTNNGTAAVTVQVRAFAWSQQADGQEQLTPAPDVMLSPAIFRIEAGRSQIVRALISSPPPVHEASYRLLIDEIPEAQASGALRFALRLSVPVFRVPGAAPPAALRWRLEPREGRLVADNGGGRRERIRELTLVSSLGRRLSPAGAGGMYLLAGHSRSWSIDAQALATRPGERWTLTASTDAGRIEVPLGADP